MPSFWAPEPAKSLHRAADLRRPNPLEVWRDCNVRSQMQTACTPPRTLQLATLQLCRVGASVRRHRTSYAPGRAAEIAKAFACLNPGHATCRRAARAERERPRIPISIEVAACMGASFHPFTTNYLPVHALLLCQFRSLYLREVHLTVGERTTSAAGSFARCSQLSCLPEGHTPPWCWGRKPKGRWRRRRRRRRRRTWTKYSTKRRANAAALALLVVASAVTLANACSPLTCQPPAACFVAVRHREACPFGTSRYAGSAFQFRSALPACAMQLDVTISPSCRCCRRGNGSS